MSSAKPPRAQAATVNCPGCGRTVANAPFCGACGAKLRKRTAEEAQFQRDVEIRALLSEIAVRGATAERHAELATLQWKSKNYEACIVHARAAVALEPLHTPAWCYYVGSLVELGRGQEAKEVYRMIPRLPDKAKTEIVKGWMNR